MARIHVYWRFISLLVFTGAALLAMAPRAQAQANVPVYTNHLVNGFQDQGYSWATVNYANTSPIYSGSTYSISVSASDYSALWLYHPDFTTAYYTNLNFWINGGSGGGQVVEVQGVQVQNGNGVGLGGYTLPALAKNTWQQFTIPLSTLGVASLTNCNGFWFQIQETGTAPTFYVDAIQLAPAPAPSLAHIAVNAAQSVRIADARWFGNNAATWDSYFDTSETISQLNEAGWDILRFPGGSEADIYQWAANTINSDATAGPTSFANFAQVATNIGAQVMITVNYGTGTPAEAAAWVANANVTNHYGFKYWELGNELYGTWETDDNTYPNDPYTYATRAQAYFQQMKAAATNIKVGVDVITGEDSYVNYTTHPATNTATGKVHYGWTPVLLSTLKHLGVTPDFASYHWYPQTGNDSDPFLLQGTSNWARDAANLRGMISNYFGPAGTNIELLCTENNSDTGPALGKQSTSLVNAIYYADNLGQVMQTEFNSFLAWDLRNGEDTDGDFDSTLYGWRAYGDLGVMNGQAADLPDRYPQFFSAKLMQHFIRGGDTVLATTSDYGLLTAYGVRRTNGELTLLVINKDSVSNFTAQIALGSFAPSPAASIYSYGMPQDNAAKTGTGSCDIAQTNFSAATNFNYTFAPYSLTVFVFAPVAPSLKALPPQPGSGQFVLQLSGQSGTPYVLQTSTNLSAWTPVSTNLATTSSINITNMSASGASGQFWRAVWEPGN
jgi:hypothetical protein